MALHDSASGDLNDLTRTFAEALFAEHPWLLRHTHFEDGVLEVLHTPDAARPDARLWISTDGGEITIGFGFFHTHFASPDVVDEQVGAPLDFLRGILEDRILVEDRMHDGAWSGSGVIVPGQSFDADELGPGNVAHIRSWSGARDRTVARGR